MQATNRLIVIPAQGVLARPRARLRSEADHG
jgi:hypothetical protein